jgi:arabinofuranan 3-O-arabinosyltransferase
MNGSLEGLRPARSSDRRSPRLLGIFAVGRLHAYGYTLAAFYAAFFVYLYSLGVWLLDGNGVPVYHDFTCSFVAGLQALRGETESLYIPAKFINAQVALVGTGHSVFSVWPYPPIYFLILAPLAALPYVAAFLTWEILTLLAFVAVVYLIVRRAPAIALVLAAPFTVWNFLVGQSGFFTASLFGAALLSLERRPVLGGIFIGCLTYKPQFGILVPVALIAAREWRAFASAALTAILLAAASIAAFGTSAWVAFPGEFTAQASVNLLGYDDSKWTYLQTVYGLIRYFNGSAALAWLGQAITAVGMSLVVWLVWRSRARYPLKAATLSVGTLVATPYAFPYDFPAIAITVAFLAKDQLCCGLLKREQTLMIALFALSMVSLLTVIPSNQLVPVGPVLTLTLVCLAWRRILHQADPRAVFG